MLFRSDTVTLMPPSARTDLKVKPFVSAGFKKYLSERSFFKGDLRLGSSDQFLFRIGLGVA